MHLLINIHDNTANITTILCSIVHLLLDVNLVHQVVRTKSLYRFISRDHSMITLGENVYLNIHS
ncbi:hypothetical protein BDF19DRAFT_455419, partial [Syncephalis fuscata]